MHTGINDGEAAMLKNLREAEAKRKAELRQQLHDRLYLTLYANPLNQMQQNLRELTDWILNVFVSELQTPAHHSTATFLGLTPDQVIKLIHHYERTTGRKAEDL
jgi:transcriptional regulator of aromatic amino acid metabolism